MKFMTGKIVLETEVFFRDDRSGQQVCIHQIHIFSISINNHYCRLNSLYTINKEISWESRGIKILMAATIVNFSQSCKMLNRFNNPMTVTQQKLQKVLGSNNFSFELSSPRIDHFKEIKNFDTWFIMLKEVLRQIVILTWGEPESIKILNFS